jgi:hypothetical protein
MNTNTNMNMNTNTNTNTNMNMNTNMNTKTKTKKNEGRYLVRVMGDCSQPIRLMQFAIFLSCSSVATACCLANTTPVTKLHTNIQHTQKNKKNRHGTCHKSIVTSLVSSVRIGDSRIQCASYRVWVHFVEFTIRNKVVYLFCIW